MRTTDDLRRALEAHAESVPDTDGVVDGARRRAAVLRWRRRALTGAGTVFAAVLVTVTAVAGTHLVGAVGPADPSPVPSSAPVSGPASAPASTPASAPASESSRVGGPPYRGPLQATVEIDPRSGLFALFHWVLGPMQSFDIRSRTDAGITANVVVFDPGTYDARTLLAGQQITVGGHAAYYVARLPDADTGPTGGYNGAIGWQDRAGAWVVAYGQPDNRAGLEPIAASVRVVRPRDVPAAFQLTYVPAGLSPGFVRTEPHDWSGDSTIGFAPFAREPVVRDIGELPSLLPLLTVRSLPRGQAGSEAPGPPMKIAGHDAWYVGESIPGYTLPAGTAFLWVDVGACRISLVTRDSARVPLAELRKVVEGARFVDCAKPATWIAPIAR